MELITWTEKYTVGINEIDNQHKGLVIIINELFTLMSKGKAKENLNEIFDHLTDYTQKHFMAEETMMIKYGYPDYENHKLEHKKFIDKLNHFKLESTEGKVTISLEILNFLKNWLLNHIQVTDKKYMPDMQKMMAE